MMVPLWIPIGLIRSLTPTLPQPGDHGGRARPGISHGHDLELVRAARPVAAHSGWLEFLPSVALWALAICLVLWPRFLIRRLARERRWYAQKDPARTVARTRDAAGPHRAPSRVGTQRRRAGGPTTGGKVA